MIDDEELPDSILERVRMLESILVSAATGGSGEGIDDAHYHFLRREFMINPEIKPLLPDFVRSYRSLAAFWPFIKNKADSYAERRQIIGTAFNELVDRLDGLDRSPGDPAISDTLLTFDTSGVHAVWSKALDRRNADPEGAITIARTLLETVIKRILDDLDEAYADRDDLPKLYGKAAKALKLGPSQHTEEPIKAILGGVTTLVNGIGTLRNRLSDSHGRGGPLPVKPSQRHASLAVNTAGAVATFLVETHIDRSETRKTPM